MSVHFGPPLTNRPKPNICVTRGNKQDYPENSLGCQIESPYALALQSLEPNAKITSSVWFIFLLAFIYSCGRTPSPSLFFEPQLRAAYRVSSPPLQLRATSPSLSSEPPTEHLLRHFSSEPLLRVLAPSRLPNIFSATSAPTIHELNKLHRAFRLFPTEQPLLLYPARI